MRSALPRFVVACAAMGISSLVPQQAFAQFGPAPACSASQVGGVVFRDFNQNGIRDAQEPGQIGVRATAFDKDNVAIGTAVSDLDGAYRIDLLSGAAALRVEFTQLPATLFSGPGGSSSVTTVAFSAPSNCGLNLGIATPAQYCEENPKIAVPTYTNGDPLDTTPFQYLSGNGKSLSEFPYNASGTVATGTTPDVLAINSQTGPTWGLAYQRSTKSLFASAFMKRHSGFGPGGTGAIYKVDRSDLNNPVVSMFVDLQALGIDTGTDPHAGLTGNARVPNYDDASFAQVGKISLGDMDISRDEKTLYVMNLKDKTLYSIFIDNPARVPTAADVTAYPVPNPGCSNGDYAAFAVKVHDAVYVGVNCTAETSQNQADLRAYILRLDGNTFQEAFQMPLDYTKGFGIHPAFAPIPDPGYNWKPWARNLDDMFPSFPNFAFLIYPMPLVSNIEFDNDGAIVFNIMDLLGHRVGPFNSIGSQYPNSLVNGPSAGDILRLCQVGSNIWQPENNGACPTVVSAGGVGNNQGPGGGEFYNEDRWIINHGGPVDVHQETATGAAVIRPGSSENKSIYYDLYEVEDGGLKTMSNIDGTQVDTYQVYTSDMIGTFGKAAGLGDLELICDEAPVQIGNRVWLDVNGNGRQDADEPGIAGVTVNLYDATGLVLIASKVTGADGTYYFGKADGLLANTSYRVRLDNAANYASGGPLAGLVLSPANVSDDQIDSDALLDVFATINLTTGAAGDNNHTYDIGFAQLRCEEVDLKSVNAAIDGSANSLSKLVKAGLKERAKLSKKFGAKKCKPLSSSKQKDLVKLANAQYQEVWTLAWSYGTKTNVCESLLSVCISSDISSTINTMVSGTANLKAAVNSALSGGSCKATSSTKKKLLKQAQTIAATSDAAISQLQSLNPLVTCQ